MEALLDSRFTVAVAAFAAVSLAVLALALFWEGLRRLRRRRSVVRTLRRLSEDTKLAKRSREDAGGILREERNLPTWLAPIASRIPRLADVQLMLERAHSPWSVGTFLILTFGLAFGFGVMLAILGFALLGVLIGATIGVAIPFLLVRRRRRKRDRRFEEQFPDAIDLLARSARAGHSFQSGLKEVAEESQDPMGEEFRQVFEEQKFGLPLGESLLGLADRIELVDVRMFVTSVMIQKETGGNLAENLDNLARLIRERFQFRRQVKIHTAHARMTGVTLAVAPVLAAVILYLIAPQYMGPLFVEPAGRRMILVAAVLQIFGFLAIRRMTDLDY